ncbi:PLP-dependent aminotransferase family protein [Afifella aestuarii]|uniref:aminotransferase-like domain-containing protein n=1 Tax=Afifella aestuarii TaxID=1909496 RepID=UPI000FE3BB71|nr:PLP-dependent aminotransferase family protein [Afifella aestuarii]
MTNWLPDLSSGQGPLYVRLADQLEQAIDAGQLPAGTRLPPQRNLAFDIGVTIGTVSRAYSLARERGLVSGEVGRGTYVQAAHARQAPLPPTITYATGDRPGPEGALRFDTTAAPENGAAAVMARLTGEICREYPNAVSNYIRDVPQRWAEAGARWLTRHDWEPSPGDVVPTFGAHAAIMTIVAAVTSPGDRIAFEPLTYASIARSVALLGRRPVQVAADREGPIAEDFERLCAQQHPKILFVMPALQNPTLAVMGETRRREIADIAYRHQTYIIEDAVYGVLSRGGPPPIASIAPERVFYVSSLSKAVAAGLRGGFVACPPHFANRINIAHKMLTGGKPFLMAELVARLIASGAAFELMAKTQAEIARRVGLAREIFSGLDVYLDDVSPFLWLNLPEPWLSGTFKNAALGENIRIDEEDEYKPVRSDTSFHGVRVGFTTVKDSDRTAEGFRTLRRLLDQGPAAYDSYN